MKVPSLVPALALMCAAPLWADNQTPRQWSGWLKWGDQKDGTYRNPVLPGDYSDLDCNPFVYDYTLPSGANRRITSSKSQLLSGPLKSAIQ